MDPATVDTTEQAIGWAAKVGSLFMAFIGGVVTATWVVATKIKGYDSRILAIEEEISKAAKERAEVQSQINRKLDRLHERIDDILLACGTPQARHIVRGHGDDD